MQKRVSSRGAALQASQAQRDACPAKRRGAPPSRAAKQRRPTACAAREAPKFSSALLHSGNYRVSLSSASKERSKKRQCRLLTVAVTGPCLTSSVRRRQTLLRNGRSSSPHERFRRRTKCRFCTCTCTCAPYFRLFPFFASLRGSLGIGRAFFLARVSVNRPSIRVVELEPCLPREAKNSYLTDLVIEKKIRPMALCAGL